MEKEDIVKLDENIINNNNFEIINPENFLREISNFEEIILIENIKIWKGKEKIWKGNIETISLKNFIYFFENNVNSYLYKNYIIQTIPSSSIIYTINEDGTVLKYHL